MLTRALVITAAAWLATAAACKPSAPPSGAGDKAGEPEPGAPRPREGAEPRPTKAAGTPNPPFSGALPADARVFQREGSEPGRYGGHLVLPTEVNPKSFNPVIANETSTSQLLLGPLYHSLVEFDPVRFEDRPMLARSREVSPDGLVWTFTLRQGVRWSDGQPFTADDVVFTFDLVFDEKTPNHIRDLFKDTHGRLPRYERLDAHTVRFTLQEVNVVFESAVGSVYPVPRHKWAEKVKAVGVSRILGLDTPPADVVGLGPFRLKAFAADQRVVVERNPHYWQKDRWGNRLPYLDRVTWVVSPDFNASLQRFRAGEVHMYSRIQPDQVDLLERDAKKGDFSVHDLGPSLSTHYLVFNLNPGKDADGKPFLAPWLRAVFEDVRFRRAVSHAIDREGLVRTVLFGRGRPLHCIVSPANKAWHHPCPRYEHDPAKAKALLDELALTDRDGDGVREDAAGHPLEFSVITNVENALRVAAAASIQADLAAVGIRMRPRPVPFNALIRSFNTTYDWDAIILGWAAGVPPDPVMAKNIYLSSGRTHVWHPRQKKPTRPWEAEVDRLVGVLSSELDRGKRKAAHDRIVEVLGEQQAQVFTFNENVHVAARHGIGNLHPVVIRPYGYWNLAELFLEPPAE